MNILQPLVAMVDRVLPKAWGGKQIAPFTGKSVFSVRKHNEIVSCINPFLKLSISRGGSDSVLISDGGVVLQIKKEAAAPPATSAQVSGPYRIKSVEDDYLVCRLFDGTSEGPDDVTVAKPYKLRTSLGGVTEFGQGYSFTYSATSDSNNKQRTKINVDTLDEEDELVIPVWVVNDLIWAIEANTLAFDNIGGAIPRLMIGDSRQWAAV